MLSCDQYLMPTNLDMAFDMIEEHWGRYRLVAGCTDILPWARPARAEDVHYPVLIDLSICRELIGIERQGGRIRLGAGTTFQQFLEEDLLRRALPVMPKCSIWFADDQIRRQATLAGNIINASPAADGTPPMLAMDSCVILVSRRNGALRERSMPLFDFVTGPAENVLEEGEILTTLVCDAMDGYGGAFKKVGHRRSLVISVACVATLVKADEAGTRFEDVRMAFGGIGPVPVRVHEIEDRIRGQPISLDAINVAAGPAVDRIRSRTRQEYRRDVTQRFVVESVIEALVDAGVGVNKAGESSKIWSRPGEHTYG